VYFHKEVSFIDGRTKKNGKTHYWILRKNNKHTQIEQYEQQNPIESSYELLWREIKNHDKNSGITIQNTMRRIIENYFKMLGKYGDEDLLNKFETKDDKEICRSLLCWINDGSHCMPDDLYVQTADNTIEQYQQVFKAIFEHTDNIGHYNMMMGIVPEHS
jgi:wobble nucleotide-excising tRNase